VLTTHRNRRRDQVKAGLAATSVTKTVIDTLRFSRDVGKPTLTDGRSRLGKSAAAKAFCAGSGGLARYILTPEDNDMVTLYRVCAKALGVADSPSKKAADVRELVERTLITSRLMLVFDEAQNLFSSSARVTKQPNRVLWLRRLIDAGVPMAFVALPDIERRIMRCVEHVGFDAAQFTDLICRRSSLPLNLCGADFAILVERLASDLSASSKRSIAAAANGQQGAQYVIDVLAVARHNAAKAGRERPNDEDVQAAIGDRPTFVYAPGIAPRKRGRPGRAPTQAQARPIAMPPPADPATLVRHSRTASARTVQESLTA
ncbi:MAG: ATP-binding protein, partial [Opitutaceae bacterium]|nr:ATP-binding protein [Opitutaceae bacterium]